MGEYPAEVVATGGHYGGANLAETYAVTPAAAVEGEGGGNAGCGGGGCLNGEGGTVEVALGEGGANGEFLADNEAAVGTADEETADAAAAATAEGTQLADLPEVAVELAAEQVLESGLGVDSGPTVEIGGLEVVVVEHLRENGLVGGVAEIGLAVGIGVGVCPEVIYGGVLPAGIEVFGHAAAAF